MKKAEKFVTPKHRQKKIRARHLITFRRYLALKGGASAIEDFISMNAFELRTYISGLWQDGMNWENYGTYWVVDHIVPLRYFDARDLKEMRLCWHHDNLRPNYYWDNHAKGYCVEVTEKVLKGMKQSITVQRLIEKNAENSKMFEKYY